VPASQPSNDALSLATTANAHGLHDTLHHGIRSLAADAAPKHPLENRLAQVRPLLPRLRNPLPSSPR